MNRSGHYQKGNRYFATAWKLKDKSENTDLMQQQFALAALHTSAFSLKTSAFLKLSEWGMTLRNVVHGLLEKKEVMLSSYTWHSNRHPGMSLIRNGQAILRLLLLWRLIELRCGGRLLCTEWLR